MTDRAPDKDRVVKSTFQLQLQLTQTRTLSITGYVFTDDTLDEANAKLDEASDMIDRQFVRADIVTKEAQVQSHIQNLKLLKEQWQDIADRQAARGKGGVKVSGQELQHLQNAEKTEAKIKELIAGLKSDIAEAKRKVGIAT